MKTTKGDVQKADTTILRMANNTWTREELEAIEENNKLEAKQPYEIRQAKKFGRLAAYSLEPV